MPNQNVEVEFQERDDDEMLTGIIDIDGTRYYCHYIRKKGVDTWFAYSGHGAGGSGPDLPGGDIEELSRARDLIEKEMLSLGYPIRPASRTDWQPESGTLRIYYGESYEDYPFTTSPRRFEVYRFNNAPSSFPQLKSGGVRIGVSSEIEATAKIDVEFVQSKPPEFTVKEAARRFIAFTQSYDTELPDIDIRRWDEI